MNEGEEETVKGIDLEIEELSEKLDELFVQKLVLIQDYINLSLMNENQIKEGFLNLAKSRYIMGPNSVSKNSLPAEDAEDFLANVTVRTEVKDTEEIERILVKNMNKSQELKLIGRLFRPLSSSTLKTAMENFSSSIEIAIERVNISSQILTLESKFKAISELKDNLISSKRED